MVSALDFLQAKKPPTGLIKGRGTTAHTNTIVEYLLTSGGTLIAPRTFFEVFKLQDGKVLTRAQIICVHATLTDILDKLEPAVAIYNELSEQKNYSRPLAIGARSNAKDLRELLDQIEHALQTLADFEARGTAPRSWYLESKGDAINIQPFERTHELLEERSTITWGFYWLENLDKHLLRCMPTYTAPSSPSACASIPGVPPLTRSPSSTRTESPPRTPDEPATPAEDLPPPIPPKDMDYIFPLLPSSSASCRSSSDSISERSTMTTPSHSTGRRVSPSGKVKAAITSLLSPAKSCCPPPPAVAPTASVPNTPVPPSAATTAKATRRRRDPMPEVDTITTTTSIVVSAPSSAAPPQVTSACSSVNATTASEPHSTASSRLPLPPMPPVLANSPFVTKPATSTNTAPSPEPSPPSTPPSPQWAPHPVCVPEWGVQAAVPSRTFHMGFEKLAAENPVFADAHARFLANYPPPQHWEDVRF